MRDVALVGHLLGVVAFGAGITTAALALAAARRHDDPREIAAVLGLARRAIPLVGAGTLLLVACGIWLTSLEDAAGETWFGVAMGLFVASLWLGATGGRAPKEARLKAETLRDAGAPATPELRALIVDRRALLLNVASSACAVAVLVLMVTRPGA